MFTSPSIVFVLLSFLAGANACLQCPSLLEVDGCTSHLSATYPDDHVTLCFYHDAKLPGNDSKVGCSYNTTPRTFEAIRLHTSVKAAARMLPVIIRAFLDNISSPAPLLMAPTRIPTALKMRDLASNRYTDPPKSGC
ncbi:uncharacterized protein EDB91DRAFT_1251011 [Suillus paluster]|uniref:uncharacterized protein n=1 Tax=Suillus paluster TaxID=48578 RepID=UPI001B865097|nr:uncharacterized protein EDB91DRAFT_1251011 [Suillus paluster]KAG1734226.1 hypothetical protein EDB91DRAFT_1251011 [Suillus paluster]